MHQVGVSPSPSGRGWRGAPGEGENAEMSRHACPHPALRATFSRREKDTPAVFRLVKMLNSYDSSYAKTRYQVPNVLRKRQCRPPLTSSIFIDCLSPLCYLCCSCKRLFYDSSIPSLL